jgi:hypothetical protein
MFEHWWISWQMGRLKQKELLAAAARQRVLKRIGLAGSRAYTGRGESRHGAQLSELPRAAARSGSMRTGGIATPLTRA